MRQVWPLLAGDTIDVYLNEEIKRLRSEHTIARLIHSLKSELWPGGVWFTTINQRNDPSRSTSVKGRSPSCIVLDVSDNDMPVVLCSRYTV